MATLNKREKLEKFASYLENIGVIPKDEADLLLQQILLEGAFLKPPYTALKFSEYILSIPLLNKEDLFNLKNNLPKFAQLVNDLLVEIEEEEKLLGLDSQFKIELRKIGLHLIAFISGVAGEKQPNSYGKSYQAGKKLSENA